MAPSKLERLSHYSVIVIALTALVVSIWQANISRQHNRLTVKPYLDYHILQEDSLLTVSFSNEGFGPAIIKKITFHFQGQDYNSLEDLLVGADEKKNRRISFNYSANTVVASGANKLLVSLKGPFVRGVKVHISYDSIYEEQYDFRFTF